jgi:toxin-antitoxin system PIN domain toxin
MILPDVNVLLYAHRADLPRHEQYRDWLRGALTGDEPLVMPDAVVSGVVRVATDRRVFAPPSTTDQAFAFVNDILSNTNVVAMRSGPGVIDRFERLCREGGVRGPDVSDAYLAAVAIDSGAVLYTADRSFARFPGLRWRHPLDATGTP